MKPLPFINTIELRVAEFDDSADLQPFQTVNRLLIKGSISKSLKILTQVLFNVLAGVLNLARSAGPELLLKDDASKPLLEKLLKG